MGHQVASPLRSPSKVPAYAWVILCIVYVASVAAPLNQFKVPPVMPVLIETFDMSLSSSSWLMSIFSITGFLLALPAGFILQRFGPKLTGLIAMGSVVAGSAMGALAPTAGYMLISRFIEGVGMGLIMVAAPAAIAMWFPSHIRGTPMGIWATCVGIGSIVMYNMAPALEKSLGWQAVWWAGAAVALVAFVLLLALFRLPVPEEIAGVSPTETEETNSEKLPGMRRAMANGSLWLITLSFMTLNIVILGFSTYYPTFLESVRGFTLAQAAFITSLSTSASIISGPIGGYLSDRIGSRKLLIIIPIGLGALMFLFPFEVTGWMIPLVIIVLGFVLGPAAPIAFAAVPEVMVSPKLAGVGMAVLVLGQNLGMVVGPWMFAQIVTHATWSFAGYMLIPVCAVGVIAVWFAKVR